MTATSQQAVQYIDHASEDRVAEAKAAFAGRSFEDELKRQAKQRGGVETREPKNRRRVEMPLQQCPFDASRPSGNRSDSGESVRIHRDPLWLGWTRLPSSPSRCFRFAVAALWIPGAVAGIVYGPETPLGKGLAIGGIMIVSCLVLAVVLAATPEPKGD